LLPLIDPESPILSGRTYEQKRNRYDQSSHLDLQEVMTNLSDSRFHGGLNLAAITWITSPLAMGQFVGGARARRNARMSEFAAAWVDSFHGNRVKH
jgi:hypothetical protein